MHPRNKIMSKLVLSITTFNILAPCYHELRNTKNPNNLYLKRNANIVNVLKNLHSHILCLQEFWMTNPEMKELYTNALKDDYPSSIFHKRTGYKQDGVAMFIHKDLQLLDVKKIDFRDPGDRVALLCKVIHKDVPKKEFLVLTTHLTFPHNNFDRNILRKSQIKKITKYIDDYLGDNSIPIILTGDLNSPKYGKDVVIDHLIKEGYISTYHQRHNCDDFVSHLNHNGL